MFVLLHPSLMFPGKASSLPSRCSTWVGIVNTASYVHDSLPLTRDMYTQWYLALPSNIRQGWQWLKVPHSLDCKKIIEQATGRYLLNLACNSHYIVTPKLCNVIHRWELAWLFQTLAKLLLNEFIGPGLNVVTLITTRQTSKSSFSWQEYLANSNIFD